jgi:hypothetical protein
VSGIKIRIDTSFMIKVTFIYDLLYILRPYYYKINLPVEFQIVKWIIKVSDIKFEGNNGDLSKDALKYLKNNEQELGFHSNSYCKRTRRYGT